MRRTQYFIPTLRDTPSDAAIASHRLMLRAGMIFQTTAGIYTWLPLGLRVMQKIENIVRSVQNETGAQEVLMPTIQPFDLWRESGRETAYGQEKLMIKDRHQREYVYAPTAEEVVTDLFRHHVRSYKELPQMWYQIHWKFRDEIRPRFGVMRGREFYMKDCYSFDISQEAAQESYHKMFAAYLKTFRKLGVAALPVRAETGEIGGDLSHEFNVLAQTGENLIYYDKALESADQMDPAALVGLYANSEDLHDPATCPVAPENLRQARGIEVGHIFYLGTKYAEPLGAQVTGPDGKPVTVHMGCYGIGVSRLVGAIIEANHDESGIVWPDAVAPFQMGLINMRPGDAACDQVCEDIYAQATQQGLEVLYDDRADRAGAKFADMDLIGLPWQIFVGPQEASRGEVGLKNRRTGEKSVLPCQEAVAFIAAALQL